MGVGQGAGVSFSVSSNFSVSLMSFAKFANLAKSVKFVISRKTTGSAIAARRLAMQLAVGW